MTCDSCTLHITRSFKGAAGVVEAQVPCLDSGKAFLVIGPDVTYGAMTEAIKEAAYRIRCLTDLQSACACSEQWTLHSFSRVAQGAGELTVPTRGRLDIVSNPQ